MKYVRWRFPLIIGVLAVYTAIYCVARDWIHIRHSLLSAQVTTMMTHFGPPLVAAACLFLLTAIFGRVYCSLICPAGLIQELFYRLGRRSGLSRLCHVKPGAPLLVLCVVLLASLFGLLGVANALDPIGLFGRLALPLGEWWRFFFGEGADLYRYDVFTGIFLLLGVCMLVVVPLFKGRWFCDRLCPAGALFGLLGSLPGRRVVIDAGKCVSCGQCGTVCPVRCADPVGRVIDQSRCVECLDCVGVCKFSAIGYRRPEPATGRRDFFRTGAAAVMGGAYVFSRELSGRLARSADNDALDQTSGATTPPGSEGNLRHRQRCVSCQACVLSCPVGIIRPKGPDLRPVLDYDYGYCQYNCTDCSTSCPAGAFRPIGMEEKHTIRIAKTTLELNRCIVVSQGTECGACAEVCPTHAVSMAFQGEGKPTMPDFDADYCIGCGACYHVCPVEPRAFVVAGLDRHEKSFGVRAYGHGAPSDDDSSKNSGDNGNTEEIMDFPF